MSDPTPASNITLGPKTRAGESRPSATASGTSKYGHGHPTNNPEDPWYHKDAANPTPDHRRAHKDGSSKSKKPHTPTTPGRPSASLRGNTDKVTGLRADKLGQLKVIGLRARRVQAQRGLLNWLSDQLQGTVADESSLAQSVYDFNRAANIRSICTLMVTTAGQFQCACEATSPV